MHVQVLLSTAFLSLLPLWSSSAGHDHRLFLITVPSALLSSALCVVWYIFSERINWIWVVQDFLGVSVCLLFLTSVHLPNLKAATMLLGKRKRMSEILRDEEGEGEGEGDRRKGRERERERGREGGRGRGRTLYPPHHKSLSSYFCFTRCFHGI